MEKCFDKVKIQSALKKEEMMRCIKTHLVKEELQIENRSKVIDCNKNRKM